jgi:hypothetical protein
MKKLIFAGLAALTLALSVTGCYVEERRPYRYGYYHHHGWRHRW